MQKRRQMLGIVLIVTVVAWLGWGTPQAWAQRARVPQTGQTTCWDATGGRPIACDGTGQDGDYQAGVTWPTARFTDRGNGTVRDNLTGLIWLKNANCFPYSGGGLFWQEALDAANHLAAPQCGLSDGSVASDWRLPNVNELRSLIDWGNSRPALPTGHPFSGVPSGPADTLWTWWTSTPIPSTTVFDATGQVWGVFLLNGDTQALNSATSGALAWPVRGGD